MPSSLIYLFCAYFEFRNYSKIKLDFHLDDKVMKFYSRNYNKDDMFTATSYNRKSKFKNLEPLESSNKQTSHYHASKTSADWNRQTGKENESKANFAIMPEPILVATTKQQQSGSIEPIGRKPSHYDTYNEKINSELKQLNDIEYPSQNTMDKDSKVSFKIEI